MTSIHFVRKKKWCDPTCSLGSGTVIFHTENVAQWLEEIFRLHFGISWMIWRSLTCSFTAQPPPTDFRSSLLWVHFGSQDLPALIFYDTLVVTKRNSTYMMMSFSNTVSHTWSCNQASGAEQESLSSLTVELCPLFKFVLDTWCPLWPTMSVFLKARFRIL